MKVDKMGKMDESGWKSMKVDESGWKWTKVDESVILTRKGEMVSKMMGVTTNQSLAISDFQIQISCTNH